MVQPEWTFGVMLHKPWLSPSLLFHHHVIQPLIQPEWGIFVMLHKPVDPVYVVQAVAVVQRAMRQTPPAEVMEDLGFGLLHLVASFPVSMSGAPPAFYLLPSAFYLLPSPFCLLPSMLYLLPSPFSLFPPAFYLLPSTFYLLPSAFHLLPPAFYLLPSAFIPLI